MYLKLSASLFDIGFITGILSRYYSKKSWFILLEKLRSEFVNLLKINSLLKMRCAIFLIKG